MVRDDDGVEVARRTVTDGGAPPWVMVAASTVRLETSQAGYSPISTSDTVFGGCVANLRLELHRQLP